MNNRFRVISFFLGILIFFINVLLFVFSELYINDFAFVLLCFLSLLLMLPNAIFSIQEEQNPGPTAWKSFFTVVIGCIGFFIWLVICILRLFNLV